MPRILKLNLIKDNRNFELKVYIGAKMTESLFFQKDYKVYLLQAIALKPAGGHGFRSQLAIAANCKPAYISRILNQDAHLSLEQGEALNEILEHDSEEAEYFLLMLQHARAGTSKLRARLEKRMQQIKDQRAQLKNRVEKKKFLTVEDQNIYYSSWLFSAVHILLTIPEYSTAKAIMKKFNLSLERVQFFLGKLSDMNLIQLGNSKIQVIETSVYIPAESPLICKHHANWRLKSLENIFPADSKNLHITSVVSLSLEDVEKIREKLLAQFVEIKSIVKDSREEELYCLNLDFFKP